MKYVQISTHADGWGKTILFDKHAELQEQGVESYVFWARGKHEEDRYMKCISCFPESVFDLFLTKIDGKAGFHSWMQTRRLLRMLDEIQPDVVHLHVLIGYYLNIEMLFEWLARSNCKVIWTLHDCWAFTGHCIHFSSVGCQQWMTCCGGQAECPQTDTYPATFNRRSVKWNYESKRRLFTSIPPERMSFITPSFWLASLVSQSFLSNYAVEVIHNHIDASVFHPVCGRFKKVHGIEGRFLILGVSTSWSNRKGLDDFLRMAERYESEAVVCLIGLSSRQVRQISRIGLSNLLLLEKTDSIDDLVDAYSSADVFFNPTKEDNFPTVNLEAEACGAPVITYDVGGCRETVSSPSSRCVSTFEEACALIDKMVFKRRC